VTTADASRTPTPTKYEKIEEIVAAGKEAIGLSQKHRIIPKISNADNFTDRSNYHWRDIVTATIAKLELLPIAI
jgi:hypothetical protein